MSGVEELRLVTDDGEMARRLFERANEPREFISVAEGGHLVLGLTEVFVRVREWIDTKTVMKRHSGTARK